MWVYDIRFLRNFVILGISANISCGCWWGWAQEPACRPNFCDAKSQIDEEEQHGHNVVWNSCRKSFIMPTETTWSTFIGYDYEANMSEIMDRQVGTRVFYFSPDFMWKLIVTGALKLAPAKAPRSIAWLELMTCLVLNMEIPQILVQ